MQIPLLYSALNPTGSFWAPVEMTPAELTALNRVLVTFYWRQCPAGPFKFTGTGFIVAIGGEFLVLTAAHTFVDATNRIFPPPRYAIPGAEFEREEFNVRFRKALTQGYFKAIVCLGRNLAFLCPIHHFSLTHNYQANDTALVQLGIPNEILDHGPTAMWIDTEAPREEETVVLLGVTNTILVLDEAGERIVRYSIALNARAGKVGKLVERAVGYAGIPMWFAKIPSIGGMSGGPIIRIRDRPIASRFPAQIPVAIGIISRAKFSTGMLLEDAHAEETWFSPMSTAINYQAMNTVDGPVEVADAIERGIIWSFQTHPDNRGMI